MGLGPYPLVACVVRIKFLGTQDLLIFRYKDQAAQEANGTNNPADLSGFGGVAFVESHMFA